VDLTKVASTRRDTPPRVVIVGSDKVGKTTLAASAPNPVGILTEDGAFNVDLNAFPICNTLKEVYACVAVLAKEENEFQTVVVDSLDWLEPLINNHVCAVNGWSDIEQPGYGKGYAAALGEWRVFLHGMDAMRRKGKTVILICHDQLKRIESPMHAEGYDKLCMKLNQKAAGLIAEWADIIGYLDLRVVVTDIPGKDGKGRGVGTGERVLRMGANAAHCGGTRFGLKDIKLPIGTGWETLQAELQRAKGAKE